MLDVAARWYNDSTHYWADWSAEELVAAKDGATISVVLPARDESEPLATSSPRSEPTSSACRWWTRSWSWTPTPAIGLPGWRPRRARVVACSDVVPGLWTRPGKGEALWKSLFVTSGELLVFVDADLVDVGSHYVTGLLGPLPHAAARRARQGVLRPASRHRGGRYPHGGGRVTELVARPLLNLLWPSLAGLVQPLSGSTPPGSARAAAVRLRVRGGDRHAHRPGRGVWHRRPRPGGLGHRVHRHQGDTALGVMAAEILETALRRLPHPELSRGRPDPVPS